MSTTNPDLRGTFVDLPSGRRMYLNAQDPRAQRIIRGLGFAHRSLSLWQAALDLTNWDLVVDVGANYGEMLLSANLPPSSKILAYEADPVTACYLETSLAESALGASCHAIGLADQVGHMEFVRDVDWSGRSGLQRYVTAEKDHRLQNVRVPVSTLDAALGVDDKQTQVLLKIDVEGAEEAVLEGGRKYMRNDRIWVAMIEVIHMPPAVLRRLAQRHRLYIPVPASKKFLHLRPGATRGLLLLGKLPMVRLQDVLVFSTAAERALLVNGRVSAHAREDR